MKKSKIILTSIVGGVLLLTGCTNTATPASIAKNLDHNLNVLQSSVNRLDTINNSYLSNPDIYPITNNEIKVSSLSLNSNILPIKSEAKKIALVNTENNETLENYNNENETTNLEDNISANTNEEKENVNNFYYYDIKPIRYNPRYLQDVSSIENGDYLTNYINKVRTLYAITSDVIEANSTLSNCKDYVLTYVVEIKDLNKQIENGTFEPNNQQIAALNNYIDDIKTTIKRINRCNGELSNEVNNIGKTDSTGITTGIDVVKSNYLKVLNHLDTRITYLKNALTTLEQIKGILTEAQNIVNNESNVNKETGTQEIVNTESENENLNVENNDEKLNDEQQNNNENIENNNNENLDNNNLNNEKNNSEINSNNETPNTNVNENNNDENSEENKQINNIDTYESTINNLDTYNENKESNNDVNNQEFNNEIDNNTTVSDNNTIVNETNNNNGDNLNTLNNNLNPMVNGYDEDKINAPNGTFQNGIITQNNLNNGVNNGANGVASGNGTNYKNLPNTFNNGANQTNKNVDTYGFNTMVDMLNHGTVNNGINTLSIESSTKPSMVNSETNVLESDDKNYKIELLNEEN